MNKKIAILLLAAGQSSRMGQPKALLKIGDKTLIEKRLEDLEPTKCDVFVVTGAGRSEILPLLEGLICTEVYHPQWYEGMGTSIVAGVNKISHEGYEGVIIVAMDQIMVTARHLQSMISISARHPRVIISARYASVKGIPALFPASIFKELMLLQGDKGARKIISRYEEACLFYHLPEAEMDLDTMKDYNDFIKVLGHENN